MIIVFGSINLDIMVPVGRMPASGETLLGGDCRISPGGKGANQAHAARLAGVEVTMVGKIGEDAFATAALAQLKDSGVDLRYVTRTPRATGCASIWVEPNGNSTIVVAPGANQDLKASDLDETALAEGSVLLLQQEVPVEENAKLAARARKQGLRVVLNAAPALQTPLELLDQVDDLIVNEIELRQVAEALGMSDVTDRDLPQCLARRARTRIIATYGADGLVHCDGARTTKLPAHKVKAVDTTAAGDTFVGVFCACVARQIPDEEALAFANRAAALSCTRTGAQVSQPRWDEIAASTTNQA